MKMYQFSIIFRPSKETITLFRGFKIFLRQLVGSYSSEKSEAHFTIIEFVADESVIPIIEKYLRRFGSLYKDGQYGFSGFDIFPETSEGMINGTFYAKPDELSKEKLIEMMKRFHLNFPLAKPYMVYRCYNPHMTLGRRLSSGQLSLALREFAKTKIEIFTNCTIALRIRNINNKYEQFAIISQFEFTGADNDYFSSQLNFDF